MQFQLPRNIPGKISITSHPGYHSHKSGIPTRQDPSQNTDFEPSRFTQDHLRNSNHLGFHQPNYGISAFQGAPPKMWNVSSPGFYRCRMEFQSSRNQSELSKPNSPDSENPMSDEKGVVNKTSTEAKNLTDDIQEKVSNDAKSVSWSDKYAEIWRRTFPLHQPFPGYSKSDIYNLVDKLGQETNIRLVKQYSKADHRLRITCCRSGKLYKKKQKIPRKTNIKRSCQTIKCGCTFALTLRWNSLYAEPCKEAPFVVVKTAFFHNDICRPSAARAVLIDKIRGKKYSDEYISNLGPAFESDSSSKQIRKMFQDQGYSGGMTCQEVSSLRNAYYNRVRTGKINKSNLCGFVDVKGIKVGKKEKILQDLLKTVTLNGAMCFMKMLETFKQMGEVDYRVELYPNGTIRNATWVFKDGIRRAKKFGDLVFIDGAQGRVGRGYCIFMPTIITQEKKLGTIAYAIGYADCNNSIAFCIKSIQSILGLNDRCWVHPKPTFIMDDKVSLRIINDIIPDAKVHRCLWHFSKNLDKHLGKYSCFKMVKKKVIYLLKYCNSKQLLLQEWNKLKASIPEPVLNYLGPKFNRIEEFASVFRNETTTLGYTCSSPAQSQNSSIDAWLPDRMNSNASFAQFFKGTYNHNMRMRERETEVALRELNSRDLMLKKHPAMTDVCKRISRMFSNVGTKRFMQEEMESIHYVCKAHPKGKGWIVQRSGSNNHFQHEVFESTFNIDGYTPGFKCSCNQDSAWKIPCRHIMSVLLHTGKDKCSPKLIGNRWIRPIEIVNPEFPTRLASFSVRKIAVTESTIPPAVVTEKERNPEKKGSASTSYADQRVIGRKLEDDYPTASECTILPFSTSPTAVISEELNDDAVIFEEMFNDTIDSSGHLKNSSNIKRQKKPSKKERYIDLRSDNIPISDFGSRTIKCYKSMKKWNQSYVEELKSGSRELIKVKDWISSETTILQSSSTPESQRTPPCQRDSTSSIVAPLHSYKSTPISHRKPHRKIGSNTPKAKASILQHNRAPTTHALSQRSPAPGFKRTPPCQIDSSTSWNATPVNRSSSVTQSNRASAVSSLSFPLRHASSTGSQRTTPCQIDCTSSNAAPVNRSSSITQYNRASAVSSLSFPLRHPPSTGSQRTPRRQIDSNTSVMVQMFHSSDKGTSWVSMKISDFKMPPKLQHSKRSKNRIRSRLEVRMPKGNKRKCGACGLQGHNKRNNNCPKKQRTLPTKAIKATSNVVKPVFPTMNANVIKHVMYKVLV